jgi:hypothetical protein
MLTLTGCAELGTTSPPDTQPMTDQLAALEQAIKATQASVEELAISSDQASVTTRTELADLRTSVDDLPGHVKQACPPPSPPQTVVNRSCEAKMQKVMVKGDTMVVGTLENIWVEPPGVLITARIDTGAQSSSVHAANLQEFERDGDAWVRFDLVGNNVSHTLERQVLRHVRVVQQADSQGSRRPVVAIRIALGDVIDTFEFTLADRAHLEHQMIIGRNFLTDIALVDVSQEFIQPAPAQASSSAK